MISKKKIVAIVLFFLMGFVMFTFANPSDKIKPLDGKNEEQEEKVDKEDKKEEIIDVVNEVDNAPIITVKPEIVKIVFGDNYDVMTGVIVNDDKDSLTATASITTTDLNKIGTYEVNYTATDRANNVATAKRTIVVLDKEADEDNDGYTNEEELEAKTNFDDEESYPEYSKDPVINLSNVDNNMIVYDNIKDFNISCTDSFYGSLECSYDLSKVDINNIGSYEVLVSAKDNLNNIVNASFYLNVNKRKANVTIKNASSVFGDSLVSLASNYTIDNEIKGHPALISLVKENGTDAGDYAITGTWTNMNYDINFINGIYTISKKTINTVWENLSFSYNGTKQVPVASVKDINNNNIELIVDSENSIDVGSYTATSSFSSLQKNYVLGNEKIDYIINKKVLSKEDFNLFDMTFNDEDVDYDGKAHSIYVSNIDTDIFTIGYENNNNENAGEYIVKANITARNDNKNYKGEVTLDAKLTIAPKEVQVQWGNTNLVYNGSLQAPTAIVNTGIDLETIALSISGMESEVGIDYEAIASLDLTNSTVEANNYVISNSKIKYNITKKILDESNISNIIFNDKEEDYDGTNKNILATNIPTYMSVEYSVNNNNFIGASDAGIYVITATFKALDNSNYMGSITKNATLIINKINPSYEVPENLEIDETQSLSEIILPDGFTFDNLDEVIVAGTLETKVTYKPSDIKNYNIIAGIDVNVLVKEKYYDVKLVDGTSETNTNVRYNTNLVLPNALGKEGYDFTEWKITSGTGNLTNVTSNLTVEAQYSKKSYTVTFKDSIGNTIETKDVLYKEKVSSLANNPVKEDDQIYTYNFSYWYLSTDINKTKFDFDNTLIENNIELLPYYNRVSISSLTDKITPFKRLLIEANRKWLDAIIEDDYMKCENRLCFEKTSTLKDVSVRYSNQSIFGKYVKPSELSNFNGLNKANVTWDFNIAYGHHYHITEYALNNNNNHNNNSGAITKYKYIYIEYTHDNNKYILAYEKEDNLLGLGYSYKFVKRYKTLDKK